jgi:hypothetical protein
MSKGVPLKDGLELGEQLKRVLDVTELGKVLINEILELGVQSGDLNVELDIVLIEIGLLELKQGVAFGSEVIHLGLELEDQVIDKDYVEFNVEISRLDTELQDFIDQNFTKFRNIEYCLKLLTKFQTILKRNSLRH